VSGLTREDEMITRRCQAIAAVGVSVFL
jgi:hypothetical protein